MLVSRRQFLQASVAVVPAAAVMPAVFSRAVAASAHEHPSRKGVHPGTGPWWWSRWPEATTG